MSRRYQDHVEVRLGDPVEHRVRLEPGWRRGAGPVQEEVPTTFLWHGRVHLVRGVLAQWTQRLPWWQELGAGGDGSAGEERVDSARPAAPSLEHEVWRVEATAGRAHATGVYDLVRGERWLLERVSD